MAADVQSGLLLQLCEENQKALCYKDANRKSIPRPEKPDLLPWQQCSSDKKERTIRGFTVAGGVGQLAALHAEPGGRTGREASVVPSELAENTQGVVVQLSG